MMAQQQQHQYEETEDVEESLLSLCLIYDLCVPRLVTEVFGPHVFRASGDADAVALTDPLMRSLPNMRAQLSALLRQIRRMRGSPDRHAHAMMSAQQRLAIDWAARVANVLEATDAAGREAALNGWARADSVAYGKDVHALHATLVTIRDTSGPQGISFGMPPSLRLTRIDEFLEYDETVRPQRPAGDEDRLYEWCLSIIHRHGYAFWPRLRLYIAFVQRECFHHQRTRGAPHRTGFERADKNK